MDSTNRPYVLENEKERNRLELLVERISDDELTLPMEAGWNIATALAHLAFWDQRSLVLMEKWKGKGVAPSPIDDDVTNDTLLPFFRLISARQAADLAVSAARAIDHELETASNDLMADISKLGDRFRLYRCDHRKLHLDQIERVLNRANRR